MFYDRVETLSEMLGDAAAGTSVRNLLPTPNQARKKIVQPCIKFDTCH